VPEAIAADAESYLLRNDDARHFEQLDTEQKIAWLANRLVKASKLSRKQHYETIADIYAMYATLKRNPIVQYAMTEAVRTLGRCIDGRTSALRIVVELHISYGGDGSPEDIEKARNLYSRDVVAITKLIQRGVLPSEVVQLSQKPGEGLDTWVRWKPVMEKDELLPASAGESSEEGIPQSANAAAAPDVDGGEGQQSVTGSNVLPPEPSKSALSPLEAADQRITRREITWTERWPTGRVKARFKFDVLSVLDSEVEPIRKELEQLANRKGSRVGGGSKR
jgi:hypothetical protein